MALKLEEIQTYQFAMEKEKQFEQITAAVNDIVASNKKRDEKLRQICQLLHDEIAYYDWVGFYLVDPQNERELLLGPYVGEPTDHVRIAFGQGICGQAAEREETFVIQDVSKENNYLSCSVSVKSEIVVPIFKDGKIAGELDIDSHTLAPFTEADRQHLEKICAILADLF
jgi:GAF domain-containing protein